MHNRDYSDADGQDCALLDDSCDKRVHVLHLLPSLGPLRMRGGGIDDPYRAPIVIGQVPDPRRTAYLDLPLLKAPSPALAARKLAAEPVVRRILRLPRARAHQLECPARIRRRLSAQIVPALGCLTGPESDLPLTVNRRRGDTAAGRHGPGAWDSLAPASRDFAVISSVKRRPGSVQQLRVRADLRCGPPVGGERSSLGRRRRSGQTEGAPAVSVPPSEPENGPAG